MTAEELMLITNESLDRIRESLKQYVEDNYRIHCNTKRCNGDTITGIFCCSNYQEMDKEFFVIVLRENDTQYEETMDMLTPSEIYDIICQLLEY